MKVRNELSKYDKKILKKKEIIIFNKLDLTEANEYKKSLEKFKKKVKKDFEIISLFTNQNLEKVKKIMFKNVYR